MSQGELEEVAAIAIAVNGSKTKNLFMRKFPAEQVQTPLQTGIEPAPAPGAGRT